MYSSNSSLNGNNLISSSYPNQTFCSRPFSLESNPSNYSNEDNCQPLIPPPPPPPNLSFFQFPYSNSDPFEDHNQINFLDDFLPHHNSHLAEPVAAAGQDTTTLMEQTQKKANIIIPRKRSSKRDRHSKINTARGLRDRRMRLSLEVAKRFFGLQDMLGFDKASKTVDWLLNQAKVEIKHLAREKKINNIRASCTTRSSTAKSASSTTSECEGVSGLDEVNEEEERKEVAVAEEVVKMRRSSIGSKVSRKSAFNAVGREKARERARERTREKIWMRTRKYSLPHHAADDESNSNSKQQCNNNNEGTSTLTNHNSSSNSLINMLSWNPFETTTVEEESAAGTQSVNPFEAEEQLSSHSHHADLKEQYSGTVQDMYMAHQENNSLLINMSKWSPMFSPLNNSGILQQPHQFGDQFHQSQLGKHWEAYNNRIQS